MQKRKLEDLQSWAYVFFTDIQRWKNQSSAACAGSICIRRSNQPVQAASALMLRSTVTSSILFKNLLQRWLILAMVYWKNLTKKTMASQVSAWGTAIQIIRYKSACCCKCMDRLKLRKSTFLVLVCRKLSDKTKMSKNISLTYSPAGLQASFKCGFKAKHLITRGWN